ncbi:MAG: hypothetical protein GYB41_05600 [Oceanospirillales bacterium]|uniref:RING-type E3 ubiquitin transferase n=1 Tax=Marinobacterium halophilum TaxID=267374 RepID=A0A2P8F4S6_9GAMM|nr:GIDE domain-containing protein [Marinobacterium halophilum]MBR9828099.1 hypothetical protein [Oceanospirillales bacterium]PSL16712.1 E3 ubiquitin ligase [Marinobacterium halophilum]
MFLDLAPLAFGEKLLFSLICLAAMMAALWFVFSRMARYRLIADTPTARIRSAPQGYVELIGHVIAGEDGLLSAPLSGRPCVWYDYKVEELDDGERKRWRPVRSGRSSHWFQINDGTGTCLIDPEAAEVSTEHKQTWRGHSAMPDLRSLNAQGMAALFSMQTGNGSYRFTERLIFEHEKLYGLGQFQTVGGGRDQLDMNGTVRDLLRSWKQNPEQLLARFDHDGNGKISADEWQAARQAAEQEALSQQQALHQLPSMNVLADPQTTRMPYLLSTHDETRLIARYRWISAGGFSLTLLFFWLFLEVLLAN